MVDVVAKRARREHELRVAQLGQPACELDADAVLATQPAAELRRRPVAAVRRFGQIEVEDPGNTEHVSGATILRAAQRHVVDIPS